MNKKANTFMRAYHKMGIDLPAIEAIERLQGKVDKSVEWLEGLDSHLYGYDELLKTLKG